MAPLLRPMTLGEILDRTFEIYRKRFIAFAGLSAIPPLAMILVRILDEFWWKTRPQDLARLFGIFNIGAPLYLLAIFHVSIAFELLLYPSITHLCSADLLGEPSSASDALRAGFSDWRTNVSLVFAQIAVTLIVPEVVCFVLLVTAGALEARLNVDTTQFGVAFAPTLLFFVLAGVITYFWIWSRVGLAWAALDHENLGPVQAVHRSISVSRGRHRAIFLSQLMPAAIWWALGLAVAALTRVLFYGLRGEGVTIHVEFPLYFVLILLEQWVIDTLVGPILPIAMTLLYYDQRARKEGYDVEVMIQAAGLAKPETNDVEPPESKGEEAPSRWARIPRDSWDRW